MESDSNRKLKVGDKVKIIKSGFYNGCYEQDDIVYVVEARGDGECPYFLSKFKVRKLGEYFAPYREVYEYVQPKVLIGGIL